MMVLLQRILRQTHFRGELCLSLLKCPAASILEISSQVKRAAWGVDYASSGKTSKGNCPTRRCNVIMLMLSEFFLSKVLQFQMMFRWSSLTNAGLLFLSIFSTLLILRTLHPELFQIIREGRRAEGFELHRGDLVLELAKVLMRIMNMMSVMNVMMIDNENF